MTSSQQKLGIGTCFAVLVGCGCFLVVVVALAYLIWARQASARVSNQLAELTATGDPIEPRDVERYYRIPESESDVTQTWLRAVTPFGTRDFERRAYHLPAVHSGLSEIPPADQRWDQLDDVTALLASYSDSMRLLHKASKDGPGARFDTDFSQGFSMQLNHLKLIRSAARMLRLQAHVRARAGDSRGAAESIHTCLRLSRSLEHEPLLVSQLVRMACNRIALVTITELLPHAEFGDDDLVLLQETMRESDYRVGLQRALIVERALGVSAFRNSESAPPDTVKLPPSDEDLSLYLEMMGNYVRSLQLDWPATLDSNASTQSMLEMRSSSPLNRLRFPRTVLLVPAVEGSVEAGAAADARRRTVDAALAVHRYRQLHGEFPESLVDLVPAFLLAEPTDPFDGQPLRYRVDKDKVQIYSLGRDRKDDAGRVEGVLGPDIAVQVQSK